LPKHGSLRKCLPRISRTVKKNKACFLGPAPSLAPQPIFCPSSARDRPFCINGTRLRTRLAGPRGLLCGPGVPGPSHLGSHRGGGWPGGGHRGGAGAFGGAAAGPRLRQRGGHVAELAGGRHLPGADLRRGLRGGLGQPPHQAPHGGEVRGGFHEVSLCPWGFAGMQAAKLHSSHRFKLRRSSELRNNGVQLETAVGNWTQRARIFRGRRTRCE
ncbi:unnamed protein product, partial [Effrenium voratum]